MFARLYAMVAADRLHVSRGLRRFPLWLSVAGLIFVAVGIVMPAYTDPGAAERIIAAVECEPGIPNPSIPDENHDYKCPNELWFRSMASLSTVKWNFVDGGGGLFVSGVTLGIFSRLQRRKSWRRWTTPKHGLWIVVLPSLAWLAQIPASILYYITEGARHHYPGWADSIGIPIFEIETAVYGLFLPYMAIWLIFVAGAKLPVRVFFRLTDRPLVDAIWTGLTALLILPVLFYLVVAILDGPILMVPFLWLTFWLALCARAAALSRHRSAMVPRNGWKLPDGP